ncbi:MAG: hypothetical protein ACREKF_03380, partial [Candidatus Methylomirabilales bacterium]
MKRKLTLRFHLPGIAGALQVKARVVCSNPKAGSIYPQRMGLTFVDLPVSGGVDRGALCANDSETLTP